ncbi:MAG: alpha/beta hydrolase-fold protein [Planctomycetaceae bacterium]
MLNSRQFSRRQWLQRAGCSLSVAAIVASRFPRAAVGETAIGQPPREFRVRLDPSVASKPYSGRVYLFLTTQQREPRLLGESWFHPEPLLAKDVVNLRPGDEVVLSTADKTLLRDPVDWSQVDLSAFRAQAVIRLNPWERTIGTGAGNVCSPVVTLGDAGSAIDLSCSQLISHRPTPEAPGCRLLTVRSDRLSRFYGRDVSVQGMVRLPASYDDHPERRYPVIFEIPGFGGTATHGFRPEPVPETNHLGVEFIRVMLDPSCPLGHHVFADSANNGPWGTALVKDFLPALSAEYRCIDEPRGRLLTGHSSGGWSSLWLQLNWPETFGGVWSTAPDPVDFRDFQRINLYQAGENMYLDSHGQRRPLARRGADVLLWYDTFCHREDVLGPGGQLHSFEACFSPQGPAQRPQLLWNRHTGEINPAVAAAWKPFDIRLYIEDRWTTLAEHLTGKLHIHMGEQDTFLLDGACRKLQSTLRELGSDAVVELHPDRDHSNLFSSELRGRISQEMAGIVQS